MFIFFSFVSINRRESSHRGAALGVEAADIGDAILETRHDDLRA
jgi:hypothetical protein